MTLGNAIAKTIGAGLGAEGLNLTIDNDSYRRLGVDFATYGRACFQTDLWLKEVS